ncbi:MAG: ribonucleoprotein [archaeon]|nr:ribonucleoprotein [archaeon]
MEPSKKPLNVLTRQLNAYVAIILKNGLEYRGTMIHCDSFMNIILKGASEYYDGQPVANYGQTLLRGSNILYVILNTSHKR